MEAKTEARGGRSQIAFDERRPRAVRRPGLDDGRGADARLHEPRGARPHARERRDPLLEPLARGAVAQGRDLRQRPAAALAALRLRRRRAAGAGRAGRARPATRASAPASTARSATRPSPPHEALPALARTLAAAAARHAGGQLHAPSCSARARARSGRRSRRRPRRPRAPAARRSDERAARGGGRPALPPRRAAPGARAELRRRARGADRAHGVTR